MRIAAYITCWHVDTYEWHDCTRCMYGRTGTIQRNSGNTNWGAKGPGLFFIVPCIDQYRCINYPSNYFKHVFSCDSIFPYRVWGGIKKLNMRNTFLLQSLLKMRVIRIQVCRSEDRSFWCPSTGDSHQVSQAFHKTNKLNRAKKQQWKKKKISMNSWIQTNLCKCRDSVTISVDAVVYYQVGLI